MTCCACLALQLISREASEDVQPVSAGEGFSELSVREDGEGGEVQEQAVQLVPTGNNNNSLYGGTSEFVLSREVSLIQKLNHTLQY